MGDSWPSVGDFGDFALNLVSVAAPSAESFVFRRFT